MPDPGSGASGSRAPAARECGRCDRFDRYNPAPMSEAPPSGSRVTLTAHGLTDVGRQRKHNEDHVLVRPDLDLYVVADGMGGHNAGDVASKLATKSIDNFFQATQFSPVPGDPTEEEAGLAPGARRLVAGIRKANRDVYEISSTFQQHQGMGSTVVAMHIARDNGQVHVAHVGDSRCYRIRAGEIVQLTRDHSLVNDALALKPDLTPDEIARLPKNIITRALGMKDLVKVDIHSSDVEAGDVFLLCSDGLSGMVDDEQILEIVGITDDLGEACELLIALANDAGGTDNISSVLVRIEPDPIRDASAPELTHNFEDEHTMPQYSELVPDELRTLLESGNEVDISTPAPKGRCRRCDNALIAGNRFCVECGTLVDS
jgi:PPM family protein phosphatase